MVLVLSYMTQFLEKNIDDPEKDKNYQREQLRSALPLSRAHMCPMIRSLEKAILASDAISDLYRSWQELNLGGLVSRKLVNITSIAVTGC